MIELYENAREKYRFQTTMRYASSIYFLLLNRISYEYSPEELSFLLGQEDDFVWRLERLKIAMGNLELMIHLNWVFEGRNLCFESYDDEITYDFELEIWMEDGVRYYQMDYFINSVESMSFFRLMENINIKSIKQAEESSALKRGICRTFFEVLLPTDFFKKPKSAREVKFQLDNHSDIKIPVIHLKEELDLLWGRKGAAPLKRSKAKSFGYRYSLHK
ncbi:hypothetical protein KO02_03285 [Sphingobacterium sp. ML3W]|uniref:hypothetical protein n=1 Tax=Sphingobacterium sp. ML3W TaxID=1538644 RepID=UPI0004F858BB|nr:hypothetical protein [Sphingobacterium sp. ML3W]AIM35807.1 hypothetical protein KO02_03285 [Sphingobacterium sp. ML3W]